MNFFRKHEVFWKIVVAVATIGLVASSFIPLFAGGL